MTQVIHIIASCTDKKLMPVPAHRRLGAVPPGPMERRADVWWDQLSKTLDSERVEAFDLYGGQHWSVVRELPVAASQGGLKAKIWIASAGYGLVSADAKIGSYSATFSTRSEDSVQQSDSDRTSEWWEALGKKHSPKIPGPRTVAELASTDRRACLAVIASPAYVRAMRNDLRNAASELRERDSLIVFSSDHAATGELYPHVVASDAVLLAKLGGARVSLHARVAKKALIEARQHEFRASALKERFKRIVAATEAPPALNRKPMTDEEVRAFIRAALRKTPDLSHSRALRELRTSGLACEQKRFKHLFLDMRGIDATR